MTNKSIALKILLKRRRRINIIQYNLDRCGIDPKSAIWIKDVMLRLENDLSFKIDNLKFEVRAIENKHIEDDQDTNS